MAAPSSFSGTLGRASGPTKVVRMAPTTELSVKTLTEREFELLAGRHPDVAVPIEQSPHWFKTERPSPGRRPYGLFAYYDGETLVATAALILLTSRIRQSLVAINGPAWFVKRTVELERRLVEALGSQAQADADINPIYLRLQVAHPQIGVKKALEAGWYDREIVVDLTPTEDELLSSFRANARQSIRKANRAGVVIEFIEPERREAVFREDLFPILQETAERDDFATFDSAYYEQLVRELPELTRLAVAYHDGVAVSWLITTEYRKHAVYYFAGSSRAARGVFAPYLLLWETFKVLKEAGNSSCGLTGIVSDNYPQLANVTTFKRNWSKNEVELPVTYDIPLHEAKYAALSMYVRVRRELPGIGRRLAEKLSGLGSTIRNRLHRSGSDVSSDQSA